MSFRNFSRRLQMDGMLRLLLGVLSEKMICGLVADVLKNLRPLVSQSSTQLDDAVLEALITALDARGKGA